MILRLLTWVLKATSLFDVLFFCGLRWKRKVAVGVESGGTKIDEVIKVKTVTTLSAPLEKIVYLTEAITILPAFTFTST